MIIFINNVRSDTSSAGLWLKLEGWIVGSPDDPPTLPFITNARTVVRVSIMQETNEDSVEEVTHAT